MMGVTGYWVCEDCGWSFGEKVPEAHHECDNCGGKPMCSECGDEPDFCPCIDSPEATS